jgi:outer membrane beta-barrel protein
MMKKTKAMRKVIALLLGVIVLLPTAARAEKERKSPLSNAPVIRRRLELRDQRFELGVGAGVTIGQDFYNALLVMPKLAFHFNDWLSLAVVGGYNVLPDWASSFNNDVYDAIKKVNQSGTTANKKTPQANDARATMNHIGWFALGQIEFIPLSGKIAILSSIFSYFDFYILAGGGIVNLAAKGAQPDACIRKDAPDNPICKAVTGNKPAVNVGVGAHAFINRWLAVNIELRDLVYKNNASGRSVLGNTDPHDNQPITSDRDTEWTNNFVSSVNFQFFLPTKPKISR